MKYSAWLKKQIKREDPIGDLSRDVFQKDINGKRGFKEVRIKNSFKAWENYLIEQGACSGAEQALVESWQEYRNENIYSYLKNNLRARLHTALKKNLKTGSAVRDLGCTIPELKFYLEGKFKKEMTWNNYGKWHIDHIKPLCYFKLNERSEILKACHYTNLQPLWAKENISKGGR